MMVREEEIEARRPPPRCWRWPRRDDDPAEEARTPSPSMYHELGRAMALKVGVDDLNWWRSPSGHRRRSVQPATERLVEGSGRGSCIRSRYEPLRRAHSRRCSLALGRLVLQGMSIANRSIFLEIGTMYTSLLDGCRSYDRRGGAALSLRRSCDSRSTLVGAALTRKSSRRERCLLLLGGDPCVAPTGAKPGPKAGRTFSNRVSDDE